MGFFEITSNNIIYTLSCLSFGIFCVNLYHVKLENFSGIVWCSNHRRLRFRTRLFAMQINFRTRLRAWRSRNHRRLFWKQHKLRDSLPYGHSIHPFDVLFSKANRKTVSNICEALIPNLKIIITPYSIVSRREK